MSAPRPESWLRGPVDGIPALLQPAGPGFRSTVLGLLFQAAEHAQRHTGQLMPR